MTDTRLSVNLYFTKAERATAPMVRGNATRVAPSPMLNARSPASAQQQKHGQNLVRNPFALVDM